MVKIDGYEVFAELRRDSWLAVYKAYDHARQRTVVVKTLLETGAPTSVKQQLDNEYRRCREIRHPNLREILATGASDDRRYVVLEYIEGPTLAEVIDHKVPAELAAWVVRKSAEALAALHQHGVLHRDIKPENIFLSVEGAVKLGDLGLAIDFDNNDKSIAGTPAYFSPELILSRKISASSDLFALGAVLYELLTGEQAFADRNTSAILHRIANFDPIPVPRINSTQPPDLVAICQQLLQKDPAKRLSSADALIAKLTEFERHHALAITAKDLADFIAEPSSYSRVDFPEVQPSVASAEEAVSAPPAPRVRQSWRRIAFAGAGSLLGAVLLIFGFNRSIPSSWNASSQPEIGATASADSFMIATPSILAANEAPIVPEDSINEFERATQTRASSVQPNANLHEPAQNAAFENQPTKPLSDHFPSGSATTRAPRSIYIASVPSAIVAIDGELLGVTPVHWQPRVEEHVYELRFAMAGMPAIKKLVTAAVLPNDSLFIDYLAEIGYVEIVVNPWAEVWIDEKAHDTTPLALPVALEPGVHQIAVRHPKLGKQSRRVVITKGDTLRLRIDLLVSPASNF